MALSKSWTDTVDQGITDPTWDAYDALIMAETTSYNQRFKTSPGYKTIDHSIFKALLWVESGGPNHPSGAWKTRPLQIGNKGDPAWPALKKAADYWNLKRKNTDYSASLATTDTERDVLALIMSDDLKEKLTGNKINEPNLNIRAGIAYLMARMTSSEAKSVDDTTARPETAELKPGESFSSVAKRMHSTPESIRANNGGFKNGAYVDRTTKGEVKRIWVKDHELRPGDKFQVQKASVQRLITSWLDFTPDNVQARYNYPVKNTPTTGKTKGDPDYADKLRYVLGLFQKLKR